MQFCPARMRPIKAESDCLRISFSIGEGKISRSGQLTNNEDMFAEKTVDRVCLCSAQRTNLEHVCHGRGCGFESAGESLYLKRGNHFVKNALGKGFIKRSVTLQPSEEQGTTKHIDQQFWIGRWLQFA
jgi:hypothetical protein